MTLFFLIICGFDCETVKFKKILPKKNLKNKKIEDIFSKSQRETYLIKVLMEIKKAPSIEIFKVSASYHFEH